MVKKILALIFSLSLILSSASCNQKNKDSQSSYSYTGRYTEEAISLPEKLSQTGELFMHGGKISFIDASEMKLYTQSEDKKTFDSQDIPSIKELGDDAVVSDIACSEKNEYFIKYYISGFDKTEKDKKAEKDHYDVTSQYAYISSDGKLTKLDLDVTFDLAYFEFCSDGRLFAYENGGNVREINCEDQSSDVLFTSEGNAVAFDIAAGHIIIVNSFGITFYNIDKKQTDTPDVLKTFIKEQKLSTDVDSVVYDFCEGKDNSIYIVCSNGLFRYVIDGNQVEQLLNGLSYHIGSPSCHISSVIPESDDSFLISYTENNIMRYHYDPSAKNEISSELRIYSLKNNSTLEQIISEFKITNPDIKVNYEVGMNNNNGITYEDAVKNLNTEILSGNAPDVIMLDNMDTDNYIQKHMLEDLSQYEDKIADKDSLLDNIAKQYEDDSLYFMTCKFNIPVIITDKENITGADNLSSITDKICDIHKQNPDKHITYFYTEKDVLENAMDLMGNEIFTDNVINTDVLKKMLEDCTKIYNCEKGLFSDDTIEVYKSRNILAMIPTDRWAYEACGNGTKILVDDAKFAFGTTGSFLSDINIITSLNDVDPDIRYQYGLGDDNTAYVPNCSLGICSSSKNKDNAVKFLKSAFSESVQNVDLYDGFPVNLNSLEKFYNCRNTDKPSGVGIVSDSDQSVAFMANWMDENEINTFKDTIEKLDSPIMIDDLSKNIIIEAGTKCLDGSITADEAIKQITSQLDLRMQE